MIESATSSLIRAFSVFCDQIMPTPQALVIVPFLGLLADIPRARIALHSLAFRLIWAVVSQESLKTSSFIEHDVS